MKTLGWILFFWFTLIGCAAHVESDPAEDSVESDPAAAPPQNGCTVADVCTYPADSCDGTTEPGGCPLLDSPGCCDVEGATTCYYSPTYTERQPCAGSWVEP